MPYNNLVSRVDAQPTIPEDVAAVIMTNVETQSAARTLFRNVPISRAQQRVPVISALPVAYFVNGDTGLKQTTEVNWANKYLNVEEIAAIVPIPDAVVADAEFDLWGAVRPLLEEAIARALDQAIFFGTGKPASWPDAIVPAAVAKAHFIARGTNAQNVGGLAGDISDVMALVENDGFDVNGFLAARSFRGRLRQARGTTGERLAELSPTNIEGTTVQYPMRGMWPSGASAAELITGDFQQGMIGVRQDITWKVLTEGVIQDNTGAIIYNLAQQDMTALRVVARFAWEVANIINHDNPDADTRYPFAVLRSPA